jgi:radical SAM superfamily enzyme YgiQ (UPF0313 family)
MHTALRLGEQIAQRVRVLNPQAHICLYGLYASLNAHHLLQETIDSTIGGEYEMPLLHLIQALEHDDTTLVDGVQTRERASGPWLQRTPFIVPQRAYLPELTEYAHLKWDGECRVGGYTEATRGCKHTCRHCPITPIYGGRFFAIPADIVLADIRAQVERGAQHITFGDPDFWNGPTHALRIVRRMHEEFPALTFDATIKIEHILKNRHLLPEFKELGCLFVVSAVESLNDAVLLQLEKGHTAADVVEAFALMDQAGIALRPSLLPFTPWETLESYIKLLNFFEEQHLVEHIDPVHLSIHLLIPPGSAHLNAPDSQSWIGELDATAYSYQWQHPDPRMDELQTQVAALVSHAENTEADPLLTFLQVKEMALKMQGQRFSVFRALRAYGSPKVIPHLSESWFCCAEPPSLSQSRIS